MATFILLSGAWHGPWCWEHVEPLLKGAGHDVLVPDLAQMARGSQSTSKPITAWADEIARLCAAHVPAILVGHSRAGVLLSEVAERVPEAIARLVYVCAFLLPNGRKIGEQSVKAGGDISPMLHVSSDGMTIPKADAAGALFYNETAPDVAERAIARLLPEPSASFAHAVRVSEARFGQVPRAYVECLEDKVISIAHQRAMQAALPCDNVISLPADHAPFYSQPEKLAQALLALV